MRSFFIWKRFNEDLSCASSSTFLPLVPRNLNSPIAVSFHLCFSWPLGILIVSCHLSICLAILLPSYLPTWPAHLIFSYLKVLIYLVRATITLSRTVMPLILRLNSSAISYIWVKLNSLYTAELDGYPAIIRFIS